MERPILRLPLEGSDNTRDLGGYAGENNKIGKFGVFLRSSSLCFLTPKDNEILKGYGINTIIDLRSNETSNEKPDNIDKNIFEFYNIPLLTDKFNENLALEKENFKMGEGYKLILENKKAIKEIFEVLAKSYGGCLFHCTAGKDRTGIVSMLILGLCGVCRKDIIANYEVTFTYVPMLIDEHTVNKNLILSLPEYIETAIDFIEENYGTYYEYLKDCGISEETLNKIKEKYFD